MFAHVNIRMFFFRKLANKTLKHSIDYVAQQFIITIIMY